MKLAFSTIGCPSYSWLDVYPMAKDLGFDGIEIRGVQGRAFAPSTPPFHPNRRERTRQQLERLGLEIPCFSSNIELWDDSRREDNLNEVMRYIELASDMGTPYVRVLLARDIRPVGMVDDDYVVDQLKQMGEIASVYGVTILIETTSEYADTARLARVLDAVGMDSVGALWDMHHPYRFQGEDPKTTVANLGHHLRYCQVKDSVVKDDRIEYRMMGEGDLPLYEMFDE
ncbi:MAG: sugar phosphate isomerase/epimerase, partial [Atopobiaceae bacterium]|nr:sugar phosphate isomerase/epimerase [Atopobiaceae bacterium]